MDDMKKELEQEVENNLLKVVKENSKNKKNKVKITKTTHKNNETTKNIALDLDINKLLDDVNEIKTDISIIKTLMLVKNNHQENVAKLDEEQKHADYEIFPDENVDKKIEKISILKDKSDILYKILLLISFIIIILIVIIVFF